MTIEYTRHDLIDAVESMYPDCYASQAGALRALVCSILIRVKVYDPKLHKDILEFEMECLGKLKESKV